MTIEENAAVGNAADPTATVTPNGTAAQQADHAGATMVISGRDLGGVAIKGALEKAGITGDQVDYVVMGHVLQAGCGQS